MLNWIRSSLARKRARSFVENARAWNETSKAVSQVMDKALHDQSFAEGDKLFSQGELGNDIFIIIEGSVFLERALDMGDRKARAVINMLGKGSALGCWSTLLGHRHKLMSFACCRKPTRVLKINGSDLNKLMVDNYQMGYKISQTLCSLLINRIEGIYGAMENI